VPATGLPAHGVRARRPPSLQPAGCCTASSRGTALEPLQKQLRLLPLSPTLGEGKGVHDGACDMVPCAFRGALPAACTLVSLRVDVCAFVCAWSVWVVVRDACVLS